MKNFTILFTLLLISVFSFAQSADSLRDKIEQNQQKFSRLTKTGKLLLEVQSRLTEEDRYLKSAQATLKIDSTVTKETNQEGIWVYAYKEEYYYNALNQNHLWIDKEWRDDIQDWYISSQTEMQFDNQGMVTQILSSYRDAPGEELLLDGKTVPEYGTSGRLENLKWFYTEDGTTWNLEAQQVFNYNNSGQIASFSLWADDEGEFLESMREVFTYNSSGQTEKIEMYFIDDGDEILYSETTMQYNSSGKLILEEDKSINIMTFAMEPSSRIATTYNAAGDINTEIYYDWDQFENTWAENWKDQYTYGSADFSSILLPAFYGLYMIIDGYQDYSMNKAISEIHSSVWIDGGWINDDHTIFYYSPLGSSSAEWISEHPLSLFPNPATESVTVRWSEPYPQLQFEIYQLNGAKLREHTVFSGMTLPVSHLKNGVYLVSLKHGKETIYRGTFIKE